MAVRPLFCETILSGHKRVEYRSRGPRRPPPLTAYLYATRPVGAVLGSVVVSDVRLGPAAKLLDLARGDPLHDRYRAYLGDCEHAAALMLGQPVPFRHPVPWAAAFPSRRPPQSWQYIDEGLAGRLCRLGEGAA